MMKSKELTPLKALGYLDDIAHGRKMVYDPHELKLIVEKQLKALEVIKRHSVNMDVWYCTYITKPEITGKTANIYLDNTLTDEEIDLLKEVLK